MRGGKRRQVAPKQIKQEPEKVVVAQTETVTQQRVEAVPEAQPTTQPVQKQRLFTPNRLYTPMSERGSSSSMPANSLNKALIDSISGRLKNKGERDEGYQGLFAPRPDSKQETVIRNETSNEVVRSDVLGSFSKKPVSEVQPTFNIKAGGDTRDFAQKWERTISEKRAQAEIDYAINADSQSSARKITAGITFASASLGLGVAQRGTELIKDASAWTHSTGLKIPFKETGVGVYHMVTHPKESAVGLYTDFVTNPGKTVGRFIPDILLFKGVEKTVGAGINYGADVIRTKGMSEIPASSVMGEQSLSGRFPSSSQTSPSLIKEFKTTPKQDLFRKTETAQDSFINIQMSTGEASSLVTKPKSEVGGFSAGPRPPDFEAMAATKMPDKFHDTPATQYFAPEVSSPFLKTGGGESSGFSLFPKLGLPTVTYGTFKKGITRLPAKVIEKAKTDFGAAKQWVLDKKTGTGEVYLSLARELGKLENEAVSSPGAGAIVTEQKFYFKFGGRRVPVVEADIVSGNTGLVSNTMASQINTLAQIGQKASDFSNIVVGSEALGPSFIFSLVSGRSKPRVTESPKSSGGSVFGTIVDSSFQRDSRSFAPPTRSIPELHPTVSRIVFSPSSKITGGSRRSSSSIISPPSSSIISPPPSSIISPPSGGGSSGISRITNIGGGIPGLTSRTYDDKKDKRKKKKKRKSSSSARFGYIPSVAGIGTLGLGFTTPKGKRSQAQRLGITTRGKLV
ncbi:MAG: hypothetical protein ACTSYG_07585 [Candidatus Heimdallarchaeota archaeon]